MAQTNDNNIMILKKKIEDKRQELNAMPKRVVPITNCLLVLDRTTYNLHVDASVMLLIRLNAYSMSAKDLSIDPNDIEISGYRLTEWISDIRAFINVGKYKEEKKRLDTLEKQLDNLLSDDKRTELEIDKIANMI